MIGRNDPSLHGDNKGFNKYFARIVDISIIYNRFKDEERT